MTPSECKRVGKILFFAKWQPTSHKIPEMCTMFFGPTDGNLIIEGYEETEKHIGESR